MSTIVTVRIDKELRRSLKKYKINVSKVVRAALRAEVRRRQREEVRESIGIARRMLSKLDSAARPNDNKGSAAGS
jgi:post-segregation antitoxin (ccd killing protein)